MCRMSLHSLINTQANPAMVARQQLAYESISIACLAQGNDDEKEQVEKSAGVFGRGDCRPHELIRHQVLRPAPQGPERQPSSGPGPQPPQSCAGMQAEAAPVPKSHANGTCTCGSSQGTATYLSKPTSPSKLA